VNGESGEVGEGDEEIVLFADSSDVADFSPAIVCLFDSPIQGCPA
jgi:hypothetical protein